MADIVSRDVRSRMMSGIKSKNTKPEVLIRKGLHRLGFRFRLHDKTLPGRPDIVLPRFGAVIFVHGCFWHGHDCRLFKWPSSRQAFWADKIRGNQNRDQQNILSLANAGWRIGVIWECALKGPDRQPIESALDACAGWLRSGPQMFELRGKRNV